MVPVIFFGFSYILLFSCLLKSFVFLLLTFWFCGVGPCLRFLIIMLHCMQERTEAVNLFSSKEAEEEAKIESTKTFIPGEVPNVPDTSEKEQISKVVSPTPEQIIAIKV